MVSNAPRMISLVTGSAVRPVRAVAGRGTGFRRVAERITPRTLNAPWRTRLPTRPELRKRDLVVDLLEDDLDRHADAEILVRALHDVRVQANALLELHQ